MSHFSAELKEHVAVAGDVTAGSVGFFFGHQVGAVVVQVRTAAGVLKAWDGAVAISGAGVTVDNSGTTDFAATDVISVLAGRAS